MNWGKYLSINPKAKYGALNALEPIKKSQLLSTVNERGFNLLMQASMNNTQEVNNLLVIIRNFNESIRPAKVIDAGQVIIASTAPR